MRRIATKFSLTFSFVYKRYLNSFLIAFVFSE